MIRCLVFIRHALLAGAGTLVLAAPLAAAPPRAVPLSETVHGVTLADEYRWMEDPSNKAELLAFVEAENARTRALLDAVPERSWFEKRLAEVSSSLDRVGGISWCDGTALLLRTGANDRLARLFVRDSRGERLFLDPAEVAGSDLASFGAIVMSPDCRRVSVQVSTGGSESGRTQVFDIATGQPVGKPIERIWGEFPTTFLPGDRVLYTQMAASPVDGDPMRAMTAYIAPLDGSAAPVAVLGNGLTVKPENFPIVMGEADWPFAVGVAAGARADNEIYVAPMSGLLAGKPQWRQVATLEDKVGFGFTRGTDLYLLSTKGNSAGTILRRPLKEDGSAAGADDVVFAGSPGRLVKDMRVAEEGLYVATTTDGAAGLYFLPDGKGPAQAVALPFEGTIVRFESEADGRGVSFALTGWAQNATVFRVEDGKLTPTGLASQSWEGAKDMAVTRMEAISKDGTKIPMVVIRRKGASGRTPTIVQAYGGYGYDTVFPAYARNDMVWLDRGGATAYCGTRGGGERGRDWHEGGRGPNKPRGMEDLAACARTLTEAGIAPAHGPLVTGGSMGGVLVPTATLRDPKAFGAMITAVGIVNPSRIGAAENGANQFAEVGNPSDPQQFRDLVAMDAYQMITDAKAPPPPTMMVIGLNDKRVVPWMTAKWMARARAKWPNAPIYMRGDAQSGHGIGSAEDVRRAEAADTYAFAWAMQTSPAK